MRIAKEVEDAMDSRLHNPANPPSEQAPPSYHTLFPESQHQNLPPAAHKPSVDETFDRIQTRIANEKHTSLITRKGDLTTITTHSISNDNHDSSPSLLEIYTTHPAENEGGATILTLLQNQTQIARAHLPPHNPNFTIALSFPTSTAISSSSSSATSIPITHHTSTALHSGSHHFNLSGRPLAWKKTHSHALGSSPFQSEAYKLVDESDVGKPAHPHGRLSREPKVVVGGETLAVYVADRHRGDGGRVEWREELGREVEVGAVLVLAGIWAGKGRG